MLAKRTWLTLFCTAVLLSSLSCFGIVTKLLKHRVDCVQVSTVFWSLLFFFVHLGAYCGLHVLLDIQLLLDAPLEAHYLDFALGNDDANLTKVACWRLILVLLLADVTMIGFSLWFATMAHELAVLADKTMDRGAERERVITKRYVVGIHLMLVAFAFAEILIIVREGGYRYNGASIVTLAGVVVVYLGVLHAAVRMCLLKRRGRHLGTVQRQFVPSPLYIRIRNLMAVFALLSLQCVFPFLTGSSHWVFYVATLLFRLAGVVLALLVGCSQQWVVEIFGRYLPEDYVAQFTAPTVISFVEKLAAPLKNPVFVFTDIESSSDLWAIENGDLMRQANELHDDILRGLLLEFNGYEITTAGDAFQLAFHRMEDAVKYCVKAQLELLHAMWPRKLRRCGVKGVS